MGKRFFLKRLFLGLAISGLSYMAFAGEAGDGGKKSFEDWKRDVIGQKGATSNSDVEISEDMLKELYANYEEAYGRVQGEVHNLVTE
jgi:hypothetical protein